jgi:hypothetical protein
LRFVRRQRSGTRIDGSRTNGTQGIRAGQHIENRTEQLPIKNEKKARFTPYAPSVLTQGKAARLISLFRNRLSEQTPFTQSSPDADRR